MVVWMVHAVCVVGCSTGPRTLDGVPEDFAVSVTVGPGGEGVMAPQWIMLDTDGTIRAAMGVRTDGSAAPPPVRVIGRGQVRAVWRGCQRLKPAADRRADGGGIEVYLAANGSRRRMMLSHEDASLHALVEQLRALAWAPNP